MASLVTHLQAVQAFAGQIKHTAAYADVMKAQKLHFEQLLAHTSLSVADAPLVCEAIQKITWQPGVVEQLLQVVATRTLNTSNPGVARCKLQDYHRLPNFFTPEQWSMLRDGNTGSNLKLETIVQHAVVLGLRNPSEASIRGLTGLYMASN